MNHYLKHDGLEAKTIKLFHKKVCKEDFLLILEFLYTGKVQVSIEKQETLLIIGNQLKIMPLLDEIMKNDPVHMTGQKSNTIQKGLIENDVTSHFEGEKESVEAVTSSASLSYLARINDVIYKVSNYVINHVINCYMKKGKFPP